jgi:hypothetical protein
MNKIFNIIALLFVVSTGFCFSIPDTLQTRINMVDDIYMQAVKDVLDVNGERAHSFNIDRALQQLNNGRMHRYNEHSRNYGRHEILNGIGMPAPTHPIVERNTILNQLVGAIPPSVEENLKTAESLKQEVVEDFLIENNIDPAILHAKQIYLSNGKDVYQLNQIINLMDQIVIKLGGFVFHNVNSNTSVGELIYNFVDDLTKMQAIINVLSKNSKSVNQILKRELPRLSDDLRELILKNLPQDIADSNPVQLIDHTYIAIRDGEKPAELVHDIINQVERDLGLHGSIGR